MITVSFIIPTYNSEKTIRIALESVKYQTFEDWECLVVDGASKDGTIDIVKEFVELDSRFRYISEKDNGVYDAFNKGWRMAKGEWVHYLGDDDHLTPDGVLGLLQTKDIQDAEVVSGHCYIERIDGTIKKNYSQGFFGCHQGKITRKSTLERFNGFDEQFRILADKDLMLRMEKAGVKIINVDVFVAYFSMTGMSQDLKGLKKRAMEMYKVYKNNNYPNSFFKAISYFLKSFCSIAYRRVSSRLNNVKK